MSPHGIFPCNGDDEWVAIAVRNKKEWKAFCQIIGKPGWTADARFATFSARKQNEEELEQLIGKWSVKYAPANVMEMMQEAGIPAGVVATCQRLFEDPQLNIRRHFRFLNHRVIGRVAHNAPAYILSETPNDIHKAGPCLGEDNEYIYKEILGFSDDEFAAFLVEGVITTEYDLPDVLKTR
jgi:crotonobetainyl-CoA:carnitine CoA-transferase CaiB-like acyl-CoA transferase